MPSSGTRTLQNMSKIKFLIFSLLYLLVATSGWAEEDKRLTCGSITNPGGQTIKVDLMKTSQGTIVSVLLSDMRTKGQAWYTVSLDGWEHLLKAYDKAWTAKKSGLVGTVKATELKTEKPQPLGIIGSPGKGVVFLGVGPVGRIGVALPTSQKAEMDKIIAQYRKNLKYLK